LFDSGKAQQSSKMKWVAILAMSFAISGWISGASADPWKDESGKSRWRGDHARYDDGFERRSGRKGYGDWARIPRGHLPPPGECRTWYPGLPAGHQPPPYRC
jgi:hypothetical protein